MSILSGYLMRTILASTLLVLMVLLALATLFEFIGELDNKMGDYGIPQALMYSILRLPQVAFQMLPMATLIGALLGLGGLATAMARSISHLHFFHHGGKPDSDNCRMALTSRFQTAS